MKRILNIIEKHENFLLVLFSSIIGFIFQVFYFSNGLTLQYNDATSHLDIARRISDSLTPGLVQIGSNWLPLLHMLEFPFTLNYFLWQSGLAGSIVSFFSFVISACLIYKSIKEITNSKIASFIGMCTFLSNANILYMQTTAMFEPLLIATFTGSLYFLIKWYKNQNIIFLISAGFMVFLSTLTRYDGWFIFLACASIIFFSTLLKKGYRQAEGKVLIFISLAGLGIVLWLIYNKLIFGSATYFMTSEFSARGQQKIWESFGKLPTKGNLLLSLKVYSATVLMNNGIIASIISFLGLIYFVISKRFSKLIPVAFVLLIPFAFHILSLFVGQSIIWVPHFPPYDPSFFNVRYGLVMASSIAVLVGIMFSYSNKFLRIAILLLLISQANLFYFNNNFSSYSVSNIVALQDTKAGITDSAKKTSKWLAQNCSSDLILISSGAYESVIFDTGLELKHFITEGTGHFWKESLINPSKYARCIVFSNSPIDRLRVKLSNNQNLLKKFHLAKQLGGMEIYIKNN